MRSFDLFRKYCRIDNLLNLAWTIAEVEARALGSAVIEPEHFLLAALKIVVRDDRGE